MLKQNIWQYNSRVRIRFQCRAPFTSHAYLTYCANIAFVVIVNMKRKIDVSVLCRYLNVHDQITIITLNVKQINELKPN